MLRFTLRGVAYSALFAALLVVFSYVAIPLGFTPVPVTLQTLAVMLAGGLLGPRYGFLSMLMVVLLTAIGFPLLHGQGGLGYMLGATGGFIWIWPVSAMLIGLLMRTIKARGVWATIGVFMVMEVFGSLLLYVTGVPWLMQVTGLSFHEAMIAGCYPFLAGDVVKAIAATLIVVPLRKVFPVERLTS